MGLKKWINILSRPLREARANRNSPIQFHNFWEFRSPSELWFYKFIQHRNLLEKANLKEIHFYSVFRQVNTPFRERYFRNRENIFSIFYTGENVDNYPAFSDHLLDKVDLSLGFEYIEHPRYLRFPIWIWFTIDPTWDLEKIKNQLDQQFENRRFQKRDGFCCMVSSHDRNGMRYRLMKAVEKYGKVDSGGKKYNNTNALKQVFRNDKGLFLSQYYLNICPENSNKSGYVTEKLFHALRFGCIPIYWGSDNMPEPDLLRPQSFWAFDPSDPSKLEDKLVKFAKSPEDCYQEWLHQSKFKPGAAEKIFHYLEQLESAIINRKK